MSHTFGYNLHIVYSTMNRLSSVLICESYDKHRAPGGHLPQNTTETAHHGLVFLAVYYVQFKKIGHFQTTF